MKYRRIRLISFLFMFFIFIGGISFLLFKPKREAPLEWLHPGYDLANTRYFPYASKATDRRQDWKLTWAAEDFLAADIELPERYYFILTGDIEGNGELEIIVPWRQKILDSDGFLNLDLGILPISKDLYDLNGSDIIDFAYSEGDTVIRFYRSHESLRPTRRARGIRIVDLDGAGSMEVITFEQSEPVKAPDGTMQPIYFVNLYDLETNDGWSYEVGPTPNLYAIADINGDDTLDLVFGTYSQEHGLERNGMIDKGWGYIFALNHRGQPLWKPSLFGPHKHINALAGVADLNGDGRMEIIAVCGSFERDWGEIRVIEGRTGETLHRYPSNGPGKDSFKSLAIADMSGDEHKEIIASSSGKIGKFWIMNDTLGILNTRKVSPPTYTEYDLANVYVEVINDIDGDGKLEVIGSKSMEKQVGKDGYFYSSKFGESGLVILSHDLEEIEAEISLPQERCFSAIVSDIIPGRANEIIVVTDEVLLYSTEED